MRQSIESDQESINVPQDRFVDQLVAINELSPVSGDCIADHDQEMPRQLGEVEAIDEIVTEVQTVFQFNANFLEEGLTLSCFDLAELAFDMHCMQEATCAERSVTSLSLVIPCADVFRDHV